MKRVFRMLTLLLAMVPIFMSPAMAAEPDPFADIAGFVGKTWKGEGKGPDGKTMTDIARWEWALGGRAVRITHSLADQSYGGETMIVWDGPSKSLVYHYFTTGGFNTQGRMHAEGPGRLIAEEDVAGHPKISKVRSTMIVTGDGMTTQAEFFSDGKWSPGHSFSYKATDPSALPPFTPVR